MSPVSSWGFAMTDLEQHCQEVAAHNYATDKREKLASRKYYSLLKTLTVPDDGQYEVLSREGEYLGKKATVEQAQLLAELYVMGKPRDVETYIFHGRKIVRSVFKTVDVGIMFCYGNMARPFAYDDDEFPELNLDLVKAALSRKAA